MIGMNATTGQALQGLEHLRQSVTNIITTRIGSRVMRRPYGSRVFDIIDHPANPSSVLKLYAATVDALLRWEPRLRPHRMQIVGGEIEQGQLTIEITGELTKPIGSLPAGVVVEIGVPL